MEYSLFKLLLIKLMYSQFDLQYLLVKHNNQFLKDLSNTRFYEAVSYFTTRPLSGYFQY